jgi:hypothetical protein
MMLEKLYAQLVPTFPLSIQKDLKTAVHVLAHTLGYRDAQVCPLDACRLPWPELSRSVDAHLMSQHKGPHTIRNVKNNLSRLFRLAETQGLYSRPPVVPVPTFDPRRRPPRPGSIRYRADGSHLNYRDWPPALQAEFDAFARWATDPLVEGRDARWKKKPVTVQSYRAHFEAYFGFLHHVCHLCPLVFEQLFDFSLLRAFVHWHVNEKHRRPTVMAHEFLKSMLAFTRQYRPLPALREQLKALRRTLPKPHPTLNKSDAWVPLAELERIGQVLWPRTQPHQLESSGRYLALYASFSLMLRLWVYIPYRQRNMREMQLHENLYQDPQGRWRIKFAGEQLKVAVKNGQSNIFDLPFPPALVPTLENYLHTWRPLLVCDTISPTPHVFRTINGTVHQPHKLKALTQNLVYRYTGKHWHPHIVRTVWATEWIRKTRGDFYTAAVMLNDKPETVIKAYAHLLEEDVAERAYQWVQDQLTPPPGTSSPGMRPLAAIASTDPSEASRYPASAY